MKLISPPPEIAAALEIEQLDRHELPPPDEIVFLHELHRTVNKHIGKLTSKQRMVLEMRFGLNGYRREHTLKKVGKAIGVTQERVRAIQNKALFTLRNARELRQFAPPKIQKHRDECRCPRCKRYRQEAQDAREVWREHQRKQREIEAERRRAADARYQTACKEYDEQIRHQLEAIEQHEREMIDVETETFDKPEPPSFEAVTSELYSLIRTIRSRAATLHTRLVRGELIPQAELIKELERLIR